MATSSKEPCLGLRCPVEVTVGLIGGKWKQIILWHLSQGTLRFGELRKSISGITQKMLTQQLRDYAAQAGTSEEDAIDLGLSEKAREFRKGGGEIYR